MHKHYYLLIIWIINTFKIFMQKTQKKFIICLFSISTILVSAYAMANLYEIPKNGSRLIGQYESYKVKSGDYFNSIAHFYNIGFLALMNANPGIDPLFIPVGSKLQIPIRMILPDVPYQGIVINLPEFRMYYFPKNSNEVYVFAVGIGREGRETPTMQSRIKSKIKNPSWTPNARIRADHLKKQGETLPLVVPPGKDNPLGDYALQLEYGANNYWIHGTNQNFGIGMRVSAGCIRMYPDDIDWLFHQISKNEKVTIINQPIKIATEPNGDNILEVHSPLSTKKNPSPNLNILNSLAELKILEMDNQNKIDHDKLKKALRLHQGIPVNINI